MMAPWKAFATFYRSGRDLNALLDEAKTYHLRGQSMPRYFERVGPLEHDFHAAYFDCMVWVIVLMVTANALVLLSAVL